MFISSLIKKQESETFIQISSCCHRFLFPATNPLPVSHAFIFTANAVLLFLNWFCLSLSLSLSFTLQKTFKVCTLNKDVQNLKLFRIWTKIFCEASYILFSHNHRLLDGASQVADDAADHVCAVALYRVGGHLGFLILLFALMLKVPRCKNIKPVAVFFYQ